MKKLFLLLLPVACVLFASCKPKPPVFKSTQDPHTALAISNLTQRIFVLEAKNKESVAIDPDSQAYQELQTPFGVLLISTKSVTPYLDGYKVKVAIGNPYYITFRGFKLRHWVAGKTLSIEDILGKRPGLSPLGSTDTQSVEAIPDFKTLRPVNVEDRTEILQPGSWNDVEFTVAPATADDIRHLRIAVYLSQVRLNDGSAN